MKCIKCGNEIQDGFKFCPFCGEPVIMTRKCPKCGSTDIPEGSKFCPDCGAMLNDISKNNNVPNQYKTFNVQGVSFDMVFVERGTFIMGATPEVENPYDCEKPSHQVTLTNNYYIGKTEVTQALWQAVMGNNPSCHIGSNKPVECVSWNICQTFISKLNSLTGQNFRLPTEAEWEFAARGGNKSNSYQYSGSNNLDDVAWYSDNSGSGSHSVATKQSNELDILDMSGNVWEWCSDWYDKYCNSTQTNPTGPNSGYNRVRRGGSWQNNAIVCRSSYRHYSNPNFGFDYLGLRLALSE